MVSQQPRAVAGSTTVMAPPYRLDGERLPVRHAPPELGEGTRDILTGLLGLDDERLSELKALGVL
mgnify:CR=1 FL=1